MAGEGPVEYRPPCSRSEDPEPAGGSEPVVHRLPSPRLRKPGFGCAARTESPKTLLKSIPLPLRGDRRTDRPLAELGGKGLFAKEIDTALLDGVIDIAIHSAKDLPGMLPPGVRIAAALPRAEPFDCLVCRRATTIERLPRGARVGTCSPRRRAQLLYSRPDLEILPIRGNIGTRLASVAPKGPLAATVLAAAGLRRLGIRDRDIHPVGVEEMLPAVGQGVIAVVVREDDKESLAFASRASERIAECVLTAERSLLVSLDGDCHSPIAGLALVKSGQIQLTGEILRLDGSERIRKQVAGPVEKADRLGRELAADLTHSAGPEFWSPRP